MCNGVDGEFMEIKRVKVAIIGGGASGLACAVTCGERFGKNSIVIIERQARVGKKILATGNGRCNITNRNASLEHYHGDETIIKSVLERFSPNDCERFFSKMGILFRDEDDGRVYPYSNQASTVLDGMRLNCERLGILEMCDFEIKQIKKNNGFFSVISENITVQAENIVFATGSKASSSLGANDSGYKLLRNFGINSTPLKPALCPVVTKEKYKSLKGVRAKGTVTLFDGDKKIIYREGEIQFTDYGISGICVFDISRFVGECREPKIFVDVMHEYSENHLCDYLFKCRKIFTNAGDILTGALNKKLGQVIVQTCGFEKKSCKELSENDIKKLAHTVKNFTFTPLKSEDYSYAQVCAGGITSKYVYPDTLMSKTVKNLYICGEMLDVDGECGGYNLHFAWGSGIIAGKSIK